MSDRIIFNLICTYNSWIIFSRNNVLFYIVMKILYMYIAPKYLVNQLYHVDSDLQF